MPEPMRCAIDVAPLGPLSDPTIIAELAAAAEAAHWDGLSIWDSLGTSIGAAAADPFVGLSAAAARTERLRLITSVLALPRRRPQLVAQAAATLDLWSRGRLVLGFGSGGDPGDFEPFGESFDPKRRAAKLDEGLSVVDGLLRGETVMHEGLAYAARGVAIGPPPAQRPRPPIWIGGMKPGALRRAARWDGWVAIAISGETLAMERHPDEIDTMIARCHEARQAIARQAEPFDVALIGISDPGQTEVVASYAAAGVTWWLESLSPIRGSLDELLARVAAGPPVTVRPLRPQAPAAAGPGGVTR